MGEHAPDTVGYMKEMAERALGGITGDIAFDRPPGYLEPLVAHLETANVHKHGGSRLPGPTRFGSLKGLVLRIARLHTTQQAAFNHAALAALHALDYNVNTVRIEADTRLKQLETALAEVDYVRRDLADQLDRLHERIVQLEEKVADLGQRQAVDRARLESFLHETRRRLPEPLDQAQLALLASEAEASLAPLYAQLEERFRGSRPAIFELQKDYLSDILALADGAPVVDIGCGRGEWLELLAENGIAAYGVDTNDTFVARNVERGLDVRHGDAIDHLHTVDPDSVKAVTAFHVIEHVTFEDAVRLVDAALVALRPGGLLILETPNPTNLAVGAATFYIDPTHRNPVHPSFLQFLLEARGFCDVEIRFLHPSKDPRFPVPDDPDARAPIEQLNWSLFGPQDYAVIGRKADVDS